METTAYSIQSNISWKLLKDQVVAVNLDDGNFYTSNPIASLIWQYIGNGKTTDEILDSLKVEFPEIKEQTLSDDLSEIIRYWTEEKLICTNNNL